MISVRRKRRGKSKVGRRGSSGETQQQHVRRATTRSKRKRARGGGSWLIRVLERCSAAVMARECVALSMMCVVLDVRVGGSLVVMMVES